MSLTSIQSEIQKLEPAERASLIDLLWHSLDGEHVKEIEAKWATESEDRIDAFERGELILSDTVRGAPEKFLTTLTFGAVFAKRWFLM